MLITGASRGIGAATARKAAAAGYAVGVGFRQNEDAATEVVAACEAAGSTAVALQVDCSNEASIMAMFERCDSELGQLTSMVNNAGIIHPVARVEDLTAERLHEVFSVNAIGAFLCAREAVRRMATDRGGVGGTIVNVGSAAAYLGSGNEFVDYAATKGAVDTMTLGLAKEVADRGIRVNCVRPGLIDTTIHADAGVPNRVELLQGNIPMQRGGSADEVADLIMYLASDQSSYITGALMNVSGGR